MIKFPVSPQKADELQRRMEQLAVMESDLRETFVRGSGSGGQKINKTSVAVQLLHVPSGIQVRVQDSRSQALNRFFARRLLCDRLEAASTGGVVKEEAERSAIRKQKSRRKRRSRSDISAVTQSGDS